MAEADERLIREGEREDLATGYQAVIPDPGGGTATLRVTAHQERLERLERELTRVRWELSSPDGTDTAMVEVAGSF